MLGVTNLSRELNKKEAQRWYSLYLSRLSEKHQDRRLVDACKQIRRYAARVHQPDQACFTYSFEVVALCRLADFSGAWRTLRHWELSVSGRNLKLNAKAWTSAELNWFLQYHPQILYFLGKYRPACRMLEALFNKILNGRQPGRSYEILWRVYTSVARPRLPHQVTLYHVYRRLGKSLLEWPQWEQFVNGFDTKLFSLADIPREDLLRDASLLRSLFEAITRERKQRLTANVSAGEQELVDPSDKVKRFQDSVAAKRALQDDDIAQQEQQLKEIFPELQRLGR